MNKLIYVIKKTVKFLLPAQFHQFALREYWRLKGELYNEKKFKKKMLDSRKSQPIQNDCKVSILCNVWNTNLDFLRQMIESVSEQNYCNWELLINNCSDTDNTEVDRVLLDYADENRIKIYRTVNRGIAENTNFLIEKAAGELVLLMDHDDLLFPDTISEMVMAQRSNDSDFVYADEFVLYMRFRHLFKNIKKPFSMEALEQENCINHPALIKMEILKKVGGFKPGFDGSQDHDLYFRICEATEKILYVPKLLYVWRYNDGSFSAKHLDICMDSRKKAVQAHFDRMNKAVQATQTE